MVAAKTDRPVVVATEVSPKAKRRTYTAEYKRRVLAEADACTESGAVGALLRREGLYSSHLVAWRRSRDQGELDMPVKRGPKPHVADERDVTISALERELRVQKARAERAEALVDHQKKLSALLSLSTDEPNGRSS